MMTTVTITITSATVTTNTTTTTTTTATRPTTITTITTSQFLLPVSFNSEKTRSPAVTRVGWPYWYFPEWLQSHIRHGDAAILNATINAKIWYSNSVHVGDGCRQKVCIQNCGQTAADSRLSTAYRNSSSPI